LGGVLPPELQQYNPFAAGVLAVSKEKEVATQMVKFMGAPENAALVRKSGMEPPAP
jgi:ABC-type molybdate transport system substrate-binding protein